MNLIHLGRRMRHMVDLDGLSEVQDRLPVVVDAGASRGEFLTEFSKHVPMPFAWYAYEPARVNQAFWVNKPLGPSDHGAIYLSAIAAKTGDREMTEFEREDGRYHEWCNLYGHYKGDVDSDTKIVQCKVHTVGINDLHGHIGVDYIDYLKMDIEGAELEVFDAMERTTADRISQFSIELHSGLARKVILKKARNWKYNFFAEYANELFFCRQPRKY